MYDHIISNVFLGSAAALRTKHKFHTIVNCTHEIAFPKYCQNCIRLPIDDDPENSSALLTLIHETNVLEHIHNCPGDVLVHCYAGIQRSCAVVACYLIRYHNMTPDDAIKYIQTKREVAFMDEVRFLSAIRKIEIYSPNI